MISRLAPSALLLVSTFTATSFAHHEALFGPQSSLAVESAGFVSFQSHAREYGINGTATREAIQILSAGLSPIRNVPWSVTVVQPFTYQTTEAPTPAGVTGPFSACDGCFRRENALLSTAYRFDFRSLQELSGKDGNYAMLSLAVEPPTGNKDYPMLKGPTNYIGAGMGGVEFGAFSAVVLGYYRLNTLDATSSKKGDNFLAGLGFAYTPIDERKSMISFQLGLGDEYHFADIDRGASIGGGNEIIVSPTLVAGTNTGLRAFVLATLPVVQSYKEDYQVDRWRVGFGVIYSFARGAD